MPLSRDQVLAALAKVVDQHTGADLLKLNAVHDVRLDGDDVYLRIDLSGLSAALKESVKGDVETALRRAGATAAHVQLFVPQRGAPQPPAPDRALPQVKNIVAVGAGKGGVGKSTVAVNLAVALARGGRAVGLMDGDIYGPSTPTLLGLRGQAPPVQGNKILPFFVHGIHAITIGALVEQDKPLIWRGPMAHGAFKQLLIDNTIWPPLDYLIVDLPPGTGDVPLSLCQMLPVTGAVLVATPQQVALDDAIRALRMFQQLQAPILGMVENMSYFIAPDGSEHDIFGRGGVARAAQELNAPYLGALPMFTQMRINSDAGNPQANFTGDPRLRIALETLAANIVNEVNKRNARPAGPTLNIS